MLRKDFFDDSTTHPLALGTAADKLFGLEWHEWEQRTTRDELNMAGYAVSKVNSQKLAAYKVAKVTIGPWSDFEIFENTAMALSGQPPNFELRQPLTVAQCAFAVDCLRQCRIVTFTEDVKRYIAACAANEEFLYLPDPLSFAMPYLCKPMYYCEEHGGVEIDDLTDGRCDLCAGRYEDGKLADAAIPGLEQRGYNIKRFSEYDYAPIAQKYEALAALDLDTIQLDVNAVDMQVARLLDVNTYRKRMAARLEAQLQEVAHG